MTLITNARLVNEGTERIADLRIRGDRIDAIAGSLAADPNETVIDAAGALLLPGLIDDQVHFREPGFEHKACIETESRAAVAGGVTSYFEMPNTNPQTTNATQLRWKLARAAATSMANYAFYLGGTNDNLEDIKSIDPTLPCGVKVFMGASTGNMLVDDPAVLESIFAATPLVVATHCEDTPMILAAEAAAREQFGDDVPVQQHPVIRSDRACLKSSALAIELAQRHGTRLHVLHLTTALELEQFSPGPIEGKQITAEACIHHLFFDSTWYDALGNRIKCNPAIKFPADRDALRRALLDDRLDIIATDHAPHLLSEKDQPYLQAPAGLPLSQHTLPVLLELHARGLLPLATLVQKACHNPAVRFDIRERGFLREGYHADLVLADPDALTESPAARMASRCGWSPFETIPLRGRVLKTFVGGRCVWDGDGWPLPPAAQALAFDRAR